MKAFVGAHTSEPDSVSDSAQAFPSCLSDSRVPCTIIATCEKNYRIIRRRCYTKVGLFLSVRLQYVPDLQK